MTAISKLTQDDLRDPDREVTQLTRLNSLIAAMNNVTGDGTAGVGAFTTLTATGAAGSNSIIASNTLTGQTGSAVGVRGAVSGSSDATAGDVTNYALRGIANTTKSAGANAVINVGVEASANGAGATNVAFRTLFGDVRLNVSGGNLGFFGATAVAKPTGVAVDAASIHAALVSLGLIGV